MRLGERLPGPDVQSRLGSECRTGAETTTRFSTQRTVNPTIILLVHSASTLVLCGLIWTVQIVHYPLFARVPEAAFRTYEQEHTRRIAWLVAPLMGVELATAVYLWLAPGSFEPTWFGPLNLGLVGLVWASTLWLQVPLHQRLLRGLDPRAIERLVSSNWLRTAIWTARAGLLGWVLVEHLP